MKQLTATVDNTINLLHLVMTYLGQLEVEEDASHISDIIRYFRGQ